jgi:hypothetical protein
MTNQTMHPIAINDSSDPLYTVFQDLKASLKTVADQAREKYTLVRQSLYQEVKKS